MQIDVVAVNFKEHRILLGECKWTTTPVDRSIVRSLLERGARVMANLPSSGLWRATYACFARTGMTPDALQSLTAVDGFAINLATLDADLRAPAPLLPETPLEF
jgi:hypothetical protein